MKRILAAALLAGLVVDINCLQGGGGAQNLALGSAPWSEGDQLTYDWVDKNGSKVGTAEYGFSREGEAWVISRPRSSPRWIRWSRCAWTRRPSGRWAQRRRSRRAGPTSR